MEELWVFFFGFFFSSLIQRKRGGAAFSLIKTPGAQQILIACPVPEVTNFLYAYKADSWLILFFFSVLAANSSHATICSKDSAISRELNSCGHLCSGSGHHVFSNPHLCLYCYNGELVCTENHCVISQLISTESSFLPITSPRIHFCEVLWLEKEK